VTSDRRQGRSPLVTISIHRMVDRMTDFCNNRPLPAWRWAGLLLNPRGFMAA
jgi:hypothetical protein